MIRRALVFTVYSLLGTITMCLLLGLGLCGHYAQAMAGHLFVVSTGALLAGTTYYVREVNVALGSVHQEAADSRSWACRQHSHNG